MRQSHLAWRVAGILIHRKVQERCSFEPNRRRGNGERIASAGVALTGGGLAGAESFPPLTDTPQPRKTTTPEQRTKQDCHSTRPPYADPERQAELPARRHRTPAGMRGPLRFIADLVAAFASPSPPVRKRNRIACGHLGYGRAKRRRWSSWALPSQVIVTLAVGIADRYPRSRVKAAV